MTDGHLSNLVLISHEGLEVLGRDDLRDIAYGLSTSSRHAKSNFQRHTIIINHPIVIGEGLKYPPDQPIFGNSTTTRKSNMVAA